MLTLALPERVSPMETMTAGLSSALLVRGVAMVFCSPVDSSVEVALEADVGGGKSRLASGRA